MLSNKLHGNKKRFHRQQKMLSHHSLTYRMKTNIIPFCFHAEGILIKKYITQQQMMYIGRSRVGVMADPHVHTCRTGGSSIHACVCVCFQILICVCI